MDTTWGCVPDHLDGLAETIEDAVERLRELIDLLRSTSVTVPWEGADAEGHRARTGAALEAMEAAAVSLEARATELTGHAAEQEAASSPQGAAATADLLDILLGPGGAAGRGLGERLGGREVPEEIAPLIGGPLAAPRSPGDAPSVPGGWERSPLVGGPITAPGTPGGPVIGTPPTNPPMPSPDDLSLDPELLEEAQGYREPAIGAVPVLGTLQGLVSAHGTVGTWYDRAETTLDDAGLGGLTPVVDAARIPWHAASAVIGEDSITGQVLGGADRKIANVLQTSGELSAALGEGDLAGAVRATEKGVLRDADATVDILAANPIGAGLGAASGMAGSTADLVEGVSPEAAAGLRTVEDRLAADRERWEDATDLTDPQRVYDARRRGAPMPWDATA